MPLLYRTGMSVTIKKQFRTDTFLNRPIANIFDEVHVIEILEKELRRNYEELKTLRIICRTKIPWAGFSAMLQTHIFENVYLYHDERGSSALGILAPSPELRIVGPLYGTIR